MININNEINLSQVLELKGNLKNRVLREGINNAYSILKDGNNTFCLVYARTEGLNLFMIIGNYSKLLMNLSFYELSEDLKEVLKWMQLLK